MNLSEVALLIGVCNGVLLLIRPIGRLHRRIDRLEYSQTDLRADVDKIMGVSGIGRKKND